MPARSGKRTQNASSRLSDQVRQNFERLDLNSASSSLSNVPGRHKLCKCERCVHSGGHDSNGEPHGVLFTDEEFANHRLAPQIDRAISTHEKHVSATNHRRAVETLSAQVLALSLADNLPITALPSPQTIVPVEQPPLLSSQELIDAFQTLELADATQLRQTNPQSPQERNIKTARVLETLKRIDVDIDRCLDRLRRPDLHASALDGIRANLEEMVRSVESITWKTPTVTSSQQAVIDRLHHLHARVTEMQPIFGAPSAPVRFSADHHFNLPVDSYAPESQIALFIGVVCSVMMAVSRQGCDLLLNLLSLLVYAVLSKFGKVNAENAAALAEIPNSILEALSKFNLDGKTTIYAVCPACQYTHPPSSLPGSFALIYPDTCSYDQPCGQGVCGEPLLDPDTRQPLRTFIYHHFHDYLAGLLSRPEIEDQMDKACDDALESLDRPPPEYITTPFEAEFVRTFQGPEPGLLFINRRDSLHPNVMRGLFTLFIDWFAAEGTSLHNEKVSFGLISMEPLNLSDEDRIALPNAYIAGIIFGEPHGDAVNHYVRPLVDDFVASWEKGVYISRTARYPEGRLTQCAIAAGVCDLQAMRNVFQMGVVMSNWFCSRCHCRTRDEWCRADHEAWTLRTREELQLHIKEWKAATTMEARHTIFLKNGVGDSEFWRLPYFDPANQLTVDAMHALHENAAKHNAGTVLALTVSESLRKPGLVLAFPLIPSPKAPSMPEHELVQTKAAIKLLSTPLVPAAQVAQEHLRAVITAEELQEKLFVMNKTPLEYIYNHLPLPGEIKNRTKSQLVDAIVLWRLDRPLLVLTKSPVSKVTSPEVIERIRHVIKTTVKPSWVNHVPAKFGEPSAGSLTAAEWRTLYMIYLPIALVSLWGEGCNHHPVPEIVDYLRKVLDQTMALVSAMLLACSRTTTRRRADLYLRHITFYVRSLSELWNHKVHRPNYHMAIHIYDFLLLFGPVHTWWCYPFERLVGILQNIPSNHKLGEMEGTILRTFIRGTRLRAWLSRTNCPPILRLCKKYFDKCFPSQTTFEPYNLDDLTDKLTTPPPDLAKLLGQEPVSLMARLKHDGVIYSRASTHLGNSLVEFYPKNSKASPPIPGSIQYIFKKDGHVWFAVRRQLPIPSDIQDPFRHYPDFPAKLYAPELMDKLEKVRADWVHGQYARCKFNDDSVVVVSLKKD